jgi:actinin alpha
LLEFAKRGLEFRVWLENADDTLTDPIVVETVEGVNEYQTAYNKFLTEKDSKSAEYNSLAGLVDEIAKNGVSETTYSEVSWASLQKGWANVDGQINDRATALQNETQLQTANEALRVDYANRANEFHAWTKSKASNIEGLSGEIQAQLDSIKHVNQEINQGEDNFNALVSLTHQLDAAGVNDNPHTEHTIEGLKSQWDALNILSKKKEQVLEKELLAQAHSGISADQLKEFKECFVHFDKDEDQLLSRLELGACLKSLGEDINFDQGGKLDQILTAIDIDGDGKATFEEFVGYMERVSSGSDTPDSIKQAFRTLAGDKDFVTEADLRAVLPNEKVEYCLAHMQAYPGVPNAYDYSTFTDKLYGK